MTLILDRSMTGPIVQVDRDTIVGRIVPWNEDAEVFDELPDGTIDHYVEAFERGAFDAQTKSGNRGTVMKVEMVETHTSGLGKVGYALDFEDRDDGQYGTFRVLDRARSDVAQMIADGIDGLSIRFHPLGRPHTSTKGLLQRRLRRAAHLVHVALVAEPAYASARVMAMREAETDRRADALARMNTAEAERLLGDIATSGDRWAHLVPSAE